MLARLADRLILCPTCEPLDVDGKLRCAVDFGGGALELWNPQGRELPAGEADLYILKFGGAGSRAERATEHPAEAWPELQSEVWAVNPPGYGGSPGRATLRVLAAAADAAYDAVACRAGDRPILVTGNSLGTAYALSVASRKPVAGMILRNPVPLRQMILGRHGWWSFYLGAAMIAMQTPRELDSVANAARCRSPAVFLASQRDRVVPPRFQQLVMTAYAGDKRVLNLADADHADPLAEHEVEQYRRMLDWLRECALNRHPSRE
ncbi:MAG: alpha/beta hydrolase [Planctomycetes bacterium]|nr:alpha/beta hydrolase [Planctomycetota bacterium]